MEMQERDIKSLKESASPVLSKLRTVIDIERNRFPRNEFYADAAVKLK